MRLNSFLATILIIALLSIRASAQTPLQVPYQTLDSLSGIIEKFQMKAKGLTCINEKGDKYEMGFPGTNFKVFSYNRLATKATVKKSGNNEILALTTDIDLSKATGIMVANARNEVGYFKLYFPIGYLKTQLYKDGVLLRTVNEDYLEFFYNNGLQDWSNELYTIVRLVNLLKIENRLMSKEESDFELYEFKRIPDEDFVEKYRFSVLAMELRNKIAAKKNGVFISGQSNEAKTSAPGTGKLIVQSNPTRIKISIPQVEDISDIDKTEDQWIVNNLPEGKYKLKFEYNNKVSTIDVEINSQNTTSVSVNLLTNDYTLKNTFVEKLEAKKLIKTQVENIAKFCEAYKYKAGISVNDFASYNPEATRILTKPYKKSPGYYIDLGVTKDKLGPTVVYFENGQLSSYKAIIYATKDYSKAVNEANRLLQNYFGEFDPKYIKTSGRVTEIEVPGLPRIAVRVAAGGGDWWQIEISIGGGN